MKTFEIGKLYRSRYDNRGWLEGRDRIYLVLEAEQQKRWDGRPSERWHIRFLCEGVVSDMKSRNILDFVEL
jgi:hypothetical protein